MEVLRSIRQFRLQKKEDDHVGFMKSKTDNLDS